MFRVSTVYGCGKREAVLGHDELRDAVQVHGMDLQALVEVVDLGPLVRAGDDRRRRRERLAVDGEADRPCVVEHHRHLLRDRSGAGRERDVADLEDTEETVGNLVLGVMMRVVHAERGTLRHELVDEFLAGLHRRLGDVGDAVHRVGRSRCRASGSRSTAAARCGARRGPGRRARRGSTVPAPARCTPMPARSFPGRPASRSPRP